MTVILGFDSDEAGMQAALDAIERNYQVIFEDDEPSRNHNANWVKESAEYDLFLDQVLRAGIGTYHRKNGIIDPAQVRKWSINRLVHVLTVYQKIIAKSLLYGNTANIAYTLPAARKIEEELIAELTRRSTPKVKRIGDTKNMREFLKAEDVLERVNIESVFRFYIPSIARKGRELLAKCPFHKGDSVTGTLNANPETGLWICRSCNEAGSLFQLVQRIERCDFNAAVNRVNELGNG